MKHHGMMEAYVQHMVVLISSTPIQHYSAGGSNMRISRYWQSLVCEVSSNEPPPGVGSTIFV